MTGNPFFTRPLRKARALYFLSTPNMGIKIPQWGINGLKLSVLVVILVNIAACSTTIVGYEGPCPLRPELQPIPAELQVDIPPHTLAIIVENQLKLKQHILDLEALSGCTTE